MDGFLYEMHLHTSEVSPCGKVCAKEAVKRHKKFGYTGIIVTDHYFREFFESMGDIPWDKKIDNYLEGYRRAKKAGDKIGLEVLLGMELCFDDTNNDILIYGFDEQFLISYPELYSLSPRELRELADREGLMLYQAHPFRSYITRIYLEIVDGIEVYNGNPRNESYNYKAEELAEEHNMLRISGTDYHHKEDIGTGGMFLPKKPMNNTELIDILKKNEGIRLRRGNKVNR